MKSNRKRAALVDLGEASGQTLGADGYSTDLVREIPRTGISED